MKNIMIISLTLKIYGLRVIPTEAIPAGRESEVEESIVFNKDFSAPSQTTGTSLEMTDLLHSF